MRVALTNLELETKIGKQLLELTVRIGFDGKIDLNEINEFRTWLHKNKNNGSVAAIPYLRDILTRITSDGVIDRDELLELQLAIERVIPASHRKPIILARKTRDELRRERLREKQRLEKEKEREERKKIRDKEKEELRKIREAEYVRNLRLRHDFGKVAGVTFPNDDGSERQDIIKRCKPGEQLILRHDKYNEYSEVAIQVLRTNGEQLGHVPEYLADSLFMEIENGYNIAAFLKNVTGGTWDKPTRGANFVVFIVAKDVALEEFQKYANAVLSTN
ncbi:MAG: HIRAN domain-containing protein [Pirellulaceae bacterium]